MCRSFATSSSPPAYNTQDFFYRPNALPAAPDQQCQSTESEFNNAIMIIFVLKMWIMSVKFSADIVLGSSAESRATMSFITNSDPYY